MIKLKLRILKRFPENLKLVNIEFILKILQALLLDVFYMKILLCTNNDRGYAISTICTRSA